MIHKADARLRGAQPCQADLSFDCTVSTEDKEPGGRRSQAKWDHTHIILGL